jgi:hypothetical protein
MDDKKFTIFLFALLSFLITTGQQNSHANQIFKTRHVENSDTSVLVLNGQNVKTSAELPEMDIFLAFGQSNMAGRAPVERSVIGTLENVKLLAVGDNWVDAANPMNRYSTIITSTTNERVGPSYSFAKAMARHTGRVIGMLVNARGGTAIQEFIPGGLYYDANIARIQQAKPFGTLKGIIWHQGESNNGDDLYLYRLDTLVTTYREAIGEKVYFVAGELGGWNSDGGSTPKYRRFNERIPGMLTVVEHADYVLNTDLTHIGDYTHFNLPSQILLGQRYAQKMLAVVYEMDISIIDINLTGTGFIIIDNKDEERITSINDFSYTFETGSDVELSIQAGDAKLFTKLVIDGVEITEAVGLNSYTHSLSVTEDQTINISIETESDGSVGILEQKHLLRVYPNPATSTIKIDNPSDLKIDSVKIFGAQGNIVYQDISGKLEIDITSYPKGIYIISINDERKLQFIKY